MLVQLSYSIGISYPLSIFVDSYGTSARSGKTDAELVEIVKKNFDLRPGGIIRDLQVLNEIETWLPIFIYDFLFFIIIDHLLLSVV